MSYDLILAPDVFDGDAIREHFEARPHYRVDTQQAWYANEDTGVYFTFDVVSSPAPEDDGDAGGLDASSHIAFNLNFFRPHIFGLEAELEVSAFLTRFPSRIFDPQVSGMGEGPYSREGFLSGWNVGNRFSFEAFGREQGPALSADSALIEAVWTWNRDRVAIQHAVGDNMFVPRILWVQPGAGKSPLACATWTASVPTVIPAKLASGIVLVRPKKRGALQMFSRHADPQAELRLLDVPSGYPLRGLEAGRLMGWDVLFTPVSGPSEVQMLFGGKWPVPEFRVLPTEAVCGDDLVALMKRG